MSTCLAMAMVSGVVQTGSLSFISLICTATVNSVPKPVWSAIYNMKTEMGLGERNSAYTFSFNCLLATAFKDKSERSW